MLHIASYHRPTSRAALATAPARGAGALRSLRSFRAEERWVCRVRLGCRFAHSQGSVVGNPAKAWRWSASWPLRWAGPPSCRFAHRKATCPCSGPPWQSLRSQPRLSAQPGMRAVRWRCCAAAAHANAPARFRSAARFRWIPRNQRLDTSSRRTGAIFSRFRPISPRAHWPLWAGVRRWRLMLARSRNLSVETERLSISGARWGPQ